MRLTNMINHKTFIAGSKAKIKIAGKLNKTENGLALLMIGGKYG